MFERNKGVDILTELSGIRDEAAALELLGRKMPADELFKLEQVRREDIFIKITNTIAICSPETVYVNTGTDADRRFIQDLALKTGEEKSLPSPIIRSILTSKMNRDGSSTAPSTSPIRTTRSILWPFPLTGMKPLPTFKQK